jgi:Uma2 family endonuclease
MATNRGRLRAVDVPEIPVPDDLSGYELVDGELVPIMPSKRRHSWLAVELVVRFRAHVDRVKTGVVYGDVWCWLKVPYDPECLRAPDVAYFGHAKLEEAGEGDIFPCPPDLVVEIFSPYNRKRPGDFQRRVRDYLDAGTPLLGDLSRRGLRDDAPAGRLGAHDPRDGIAGWRGSASGLHHQAGRAVQGDALKRAEI